MDKNVTEGAKLRFKWSGTGYKFTGSCENTVYGDNATSKLKTDQYTCTIATDGSYADIKLHNVSDIHGNGALGVIPFVEFKIGSRNPDYMGEEFLQIFVYNQ